MKRHRGPYLLLGMLGAVICLLLVGALVAKFIIDNYLRSEEFRRFIAVRTGATLHAEVSAQPFRFSSSSFYTDGFQALGQPGAAFSALTVDQVRVEVSARRFFEKVWQIDNIDVQRAQLSLDGPRVAGEEPIAPALAAPATPASSGFFPNRVEIAAATIRAAGVHWADGGIENTVLRLEQKDGGWNISGAGGQLRQKDFSPAEIASLKLRYRAPSLYIQSAELHPREGGSLLASGEIKFGESADLLVKLDAVSVSPLLPEDWRARLAGQLSGDVQVRSPLPSSAPPSLVGSLRLSDGRLQALPVLNQIAALTRTDRFRTLTLSAAQADFERNSERLRVKNIILESSGLLRIEGALDVVNGRVNGDFQVGVTPASLAWLPGSQEHVFTVSHGGYLWTSMHVTGTAENPTEDLSPRLIAAAGGAAVDTALSVLHGVVPSLEKAGGVTGQARKTAEGVLDLLFGQ